MKTFKKIVVATDFSDNSKSAYRYARHLATHFGASIEVVNFFEIPINPANPNYLDLMPSFDQLEESANTRLAHFVNDSEIGQGNTIVASRIKTTFKAKPGFASEALIEISKDPSVDLLILGSTGEHGWIDKVFGSIAVTVSREAYCPVLLVPHGAEYKGVHNIVYSSSFDSAKPREIKIALDFAKYFASIIHFVHVVNDPDDLGITDKFLFKRLVGMEHTKVPYIVENVHAFTPAEGINQYVLKNNIDMLISVTRHRTLWEKLMHVSTTKTLAWNAHLPLLVLHHDEASQPPV
jgi:nucleotide-binding universal stress UspA family protein